VSLLRDVSVSEFEQHKGELPPLVATRAAHVIYENQRVLDAVQALHNGDVATFGHLMNQSHDSLRDLYAVSSKELDAVVDIARATPGVLGARMTGAGFGGCAIALVNDANVSELKDAVKREYPIRTGRTPRVYACVPSAGAGWSAII
jgi:galactokinase